MLVLVHESDNLDNDRVPVVTEAVLDEGEDNNVKVLVKKVQEYFLLAQRLIDCRDVENVSDEKQAVGYHGDIFG